MMNKDWWKSRTLWLGIASLVVYLVKEAFGIELGAKVEGLVVPVLTILFIVLRLDTKEPIRLPQVGGLKVLALVCGVALLAGCSNFEVIGQGITVNRTGAPLLDQTQEFDVVQEAWVPWMAADGYPYLDENGDYILVRTVTSVYQSSQEDSSNQAKVVSDLIGALERAYGVQQTQQTQRARYKAVTRLQTAPVETEFR